MILVPWNSSFRRRSKVTRRGSFVSPVASAIPHPSGRCYVSDFHTRISAERQLQVTASGKYGITRLRRRLPISDPAHPPPAGGGCAISMPQTNKTGFGRGQGEQELELRVRVSCLEAEPGCASAPVLSDVAP